MKRFLLAFGLVLAALPAGAVSTTTVPLTTTWLDLGAGPLQVQTNNQSQTIYQIGDAPPAAGAGGFFLQGVGVPQQIPTTSHVYVRARSSAPGAVPAVTYAPVVLASGGGGGGGSGGPSSITSPVGSNTKANSVSTTFATDQLLPAFAAPPTFTQGTPATLANAWPFYLSQGNAVLSGANMLPAHDFDQRNSGTLTATAGQVVNIPLNGAASLGLTVSGVTSTSSTLSFNTSNDGGATYLTKGAINCSAPGANPTTLSADGQTRFDVSGATNLQLKVNSGGGGTISYAYNASTAPVACPNVPVTLTPALSDGTVLAKDGADGTGITPLAGGSGIRGWLSGIYKAVTGVLTTASAPTSFALLTNASATGPVVTANGGNYLLALSGTFGGATVTVNATVNGVTTALGTYTSAPATPPQFTIATGTTVQAVVSGGTPSGLNATLGGIGNATTTTSGTGATTITPTGLTTTNAKVTIGTTNTYQTVLAANAARKGCTIQYRGAGTGYVFFGTGAPADTTTSIALGQNQTVACQVGGNSVLTDGIFATATAGDTFVVNSQ